MLKLCGQMAFARRVTKIKEDDVKRFYLLMLAALILMVSTAGCNTMRGAGTDIKNTGKHIENIGN